LLGVVLAGGLEGGELDLLHLLPARSGTSTRAAAIRAIRHQHPGSRHPRDPGIRHPRDALKCGLGCRV
jgi:hypothetical protein